MATGDGEWVNWLFWSRPVEIGVHCITSSYVPSSIVCISALVALGCRLCVSAASVCKWSGKRTKRKAENDEDGERRCRREGNWRNWSRESLCWALSPSPTVVACMRAQSSIHRSSASSWTFLDARASCLTRISGRWKHRLDVRYLRLRRCTRYFTLLVKTHRPKVQSSNAIHSNWLLLVLLVSYCSQHSSLVCNPWVPEQCGWHLFE